jgi:hypothetical protein
MSSSLRTSCQTPDVDLDCCARDRMGAVPRHVQSYPGVVDRPKHVMPTGDATVTTSPAMAAFTSSPPKTTGRALADGSLVFLISLILPRRLSGLIRRRDRLGFVSLRPIRLPCDSLI